MSKDKKSKPILRSERQAKMDARNRKLEDHINKGVESYVQDFYNDNKEARKNARWYEAGEALKEAKVQAQHDADAEFLEEFSTWAEKEQESYYAELDAKEEAMLLAEDDVIEVEYKEIAPSRKGRKSLLGGNRPNLLSSSSSSNNKVKSLPSAEEENDPFSID